MPRSTPRSGFALLVTACLGATLLIGPGRGAVAAPPTTPSTAAKAAAADTSPSNRKRKRDCRLSERGVTQCRPLVGAAHGANSEPVVLEEGAGRALGIRRTYYTGSQVDSAVRIAADDISNNRVPWISFKLPYSWSDMASGRGDAWATDLANKLDALPGPVWLAFHHEPEGDGPIDDWRRMQERLAPLVRQIADNVAYTVVLTGWNQLYGAQAYRFDNIWPRDTKVDIAGFDLYNEYGLTKNGKTDYRWPCMTCVFYKPLASWAKANDVAWGIAEFGWTDEASQKRPTWLKRTYRHVRKQGGVAFTYFDTPYNSLGSWDLTGAVKQKQFTDIVRRSPVPKMR
ncbi:hypothetical protein [Nocardioides sp.]|uniref:hypothetical protein n=1 Tax=Nocardioides sp. TaxID=35761 RepID=UPI002B27B0F3|nr:hypothetical protein [Nocardioides sp.]